MEFSLTSYDRSKAIQFKTFEELLDYIKKIGEINGWILHVHHM